MEDFLKVLSEYGFFLYRAALVGLTLFMAHAAARKDEWEKEATLTVVFYLAYAFSLLYLPTHWLMAPKLMVLWAVCLHVVTDRRELVLATLLLATLVTGAAGAGWANQLEEQRDENFVVAYILTGPTGAESAPEITHDAGTGMYEFDVFVAESGEPLHKEVPETEVALNFSGEAYFASYELVRTEISIFDPSAGRAPEWLNRFYRREEEGWRLNLPEGTTIKEIYKGKEVM